MRGIFRGRQPVRAWFAIRTALIKRPAENWCLTTKRILPHHLAPDARQQPRTVSVKAQFRSDHFIAVSARSTFGEDRIAPSAENEWFVPQR